MKISRYRMKTHEMLDNGRIVNACFSKDVQDLEDNHRSIKEKLEDSERIVGEILDSYDNLPNDLKKLLQEEDLGRVLEKKLQDTDLLYNVDECPECGADPGCNIDCHTCLVIAKKIDMVLKDRT